MYLENVKVKSEETGLSTPHSLLHSESVNLLLNQLAVVKSILKVTTSMEIHLLHYSKVGVQIWENTVWFKYMKICASLAVLWGIALPHLLYKCPHKIDRQMKKCQSSKVLLVMVMAPVKWNVKCVVVCHCVCSCQSLLNIAITAGSPTIL